MSSIVEIPLQAILLATNDFAEENLIASGGYGPVYQGKSEKHGMMAVKRLDRKNGQGDVEFRKEITLLSEYKHENIVSLLGFCDKNDEKILVYKLESNGSLDKHLNNEDLSWIQRLRICFDAARGLKYLHDDVGPQRRILHRDVKSANILLDESWNAKISDFGLSRIGPANMQTTLLISNACGTFGYIDPEYLHTGCLTQRSDVYSFGVVLFEVLCGRPTRIKAYNDERQFLTVLVYKHYARQTLDEIIPLYLLNQINKASLDTFLTIAYQCLKNGIERPTMNYVMQQLQKALVDQLFFNFLNSNESLSSANNAPAFWPHTGGDIRWEAINFIIAADGIIGLSHFKVLKSLGSGDIGNVFLVELRGTNTFFAVKVMDKASLASRKKLLRAQTEREILGLLDHPFFPTLYYCSETDKFCALFMEFCCGGDLYTLRKKQPTNHFTEEATRFYASQVLLALEYLHMLGIIYRDLKPENVLIRDEGHIMLSDFDLSFRCSVNPTLVKLSSTHAGNNLGINGGGGNGGGVGTRAEDENVVHTCSNLASNIFTRILPLKKSQKSISDHELMAEPTNVKSMSFVGTHEYLAPEIIRGEGHGSAVDWWTFGIFLYELLYGTTPFKGQDNRTTLFNVVGQPLRFPESPQISHNARDLIKGLLVKEPQKRIAYRRGATEIKQHPFFEGVNWALVRSAHPPHVPEPIDFSQFASKDRSHSAEKKVSGNKKSSSNDPYGNFEYF